MQCHSCSHGLYNSVHVIDTNDTSIQIVPPIHGPVHVTNCGKDTKIQIPFSRQLRIHDCTAVTFIIHVASGPIIEGCQGMKFYQRDYKAPKGAPLEEFDHSANLYWDVKDFHWLKNNVKSPNFEVYNEDALKEEDILINYFSSSLEIVESPKGDEEAAPSPESESDEESSEDEL